MNIHETIWRIGNELRGSVDGWDFKQYVLGVLSYRFLSENLESYINRTEQSVNYAGLTDSEAEALRQKTVLEKGFFMLPRELFKNARERAMQDNELNQTLANTFKNIELSAQGTQSERALKGLFDDLDLNSKKLGTNVEERNDKLRKLLNTIGDLRMGDYQDNSTDLFGDAYEYLMTMYASNAGKSGGEFFTPQEVSQLLARITIVGKKEVDKVYDPTCGSGSLLLQFAKVLGKENVRGGFFGQEINNTSYNLCRINMFLHDINYKNFDIANGDTLMKPHHADAQSFEAIVSNPPYSLKWEGAKNAQLLNDPRFSPAGVLAPKTKADLAFVMHALYCLAKDGTAAIVSSPGILYRGGAEQKIRQYLIQENHIEAVIQLPEELFFGTTIPTCILVIKQNRSGSQVLFIDASKEFTRDRKKNKLEQKHIQKILDVYESCETREYFSRLVEHAEIKDMDYNLSVNRYVEPEYIEEKIDIKALNAEIKESYAQLNKIRAKIDAFIEDLEPRVDKTEEP